MTEGLLPDAPDARLPVWLDWMLSNTQAGLMLLDAQLQIVFANKWFLLRARMNAEELTGVALMEAFPVLKGGHFERALVTAVRTGFPALLSQTLHPAPFPLYAPAGMRTHDMVIRQSIHIVPMGPIDATLAGQRFTLIQVADVSPTVARERLLKARADHMSELVHIDALTGIGNRRYFDESMAAELRAASRSGAWLSLIMLDVDRFKQFNDLYGHPAGDRCLRALADVLKQVCRRPRDLVARYGGEELAVILPETHAAGAIQVARDIQQLLRARNLVHADNLGRSVVTLSAGICAVQPSPSDTAESLVSRADQALYAAKSDGRDRVFWFDTAHKKVVAA